ncbi:MAG TPA: hypothetical protein VGL38_09490 [bacterium]|jgi:hypothetical protein
MINQLLPHLELAVIVFGFVVGTLKYLGLVYADRDASLRQVIAHGHDSLVSKGLVEVLQTVYRRLFASFIMLIAKRYALPTLVLCFVLLHALTLSQATGYFSIDGAYLMPIYREVNLAQVPSTFWSEGYVHALRISPSIWQIGGATIELTLLDLYSLLATLFLIGVARTARNAGFLTITLSVGVVTLAAVIWIVAKSVYFWFMRDPMIGLLNSAFDVLLFGTLTWLITRPVIDMKPIPAALRKFSKLMGYPILLWIPFFIMALTSGRFASVIETVRLNLFPFYLPLLLMLVFFVFAALIVLAALGSMLHMIIEVAKSHKDDSADVLQTVEDTAVDGESKAITHGFRKGRTGSTTLTPTRIAEAGAKLKESSPVIYFVAKTILRLNRQRLQKITEVLGHVGTGLVLLWLSSFGLVIWYLSPLIFDPLAGRFMAWLVVGSTLSTMAAIVATFPALIVRFIPKWVHNFIIRLLGAMRRDDMKVLDHIGILIGSTAAIIVFVVSFFA